jgi:hypothetical protein
MGGCRESDSSDGDTSDRARDGEATRDKYVHGLSIIPVGAPAAMLARPPFEFHEQLDQFDAGGGEAVVGRLCVVMVLRARCPVAEHVDRATDLSGGSCSDGGG